VSDEFERGQAFGAYVLEARLGGGGFGTVWRARDTNTGQLVALKILAGKFSAGETGRLRADVELLAAAASSGSKHVVRVLGGGPDPVPHVVMEYIEGVNLEEELHRLGTMPQHEALLVIRGVAEALAVLQRAGIIHRDVKPANVMLTRDGTVKLTDFGIAKIAGYESVTATGQLPLTGAYAAPEVWGGEATYQSDYYALGAMVFELLTGTRPFSGNFVQLYEMHRNRDPDYALLPGEVVPALRRLIVECLQKEPARRPRDASVVLALVDEAETQLSTNQVDSPAAVTHEPRALGPWLIESAHPSQPWAFRCLHETSGERVTVEVHFSDSLELGEGLKRAVATNPSLVPLGAERLLGTNRLILRPGEAWPDQPNKQFAFWVARQELPAPNAPAAVDDALAEKYATSALQLTGTAGAHGVVFRPSPDSTLLGHNGQVYATRVGLPGGEGSSVIEWLRTVMPVYTVFDGIYDDTALATFVEERERSREAAAPGMARVAATAAASEIAEESTLLDRSELGSPTPPPTEPAPEPHRVSPVPERPTPIGSPPGPRSPRRWFGGGAGGVVVAALIAAGVIFGFSGGDDPPVDCDGDECATSTHTAIVTATATASATAVPPPGPFPARALPRQGDKCGDFTIWREEGKPAAPNGLPNSDSITVLDKSGATILSLPSQQLVGGNGPEAALVKSCYDLDGDGTMELLTQFYPGGTNVADSTLYRLGSPATKLAELAGITLGAKDLDGSAPFELVGTDLRWKYFATSGADSTYPAIVFQLKDGKPDIVTGSFPDLVRADRERHMARLPACLELKRDGPDTGFDACHIGVLTSVMVDSLLLGDWDTFRQQSTIDRTVADRLEKCRDYILAKATSLAPPTSLCDTSVSATPTPTPTASATPRPPTPTPAATSTVPASQTPSDSWRLWANNVFFVDATSLSDGELSIRFDVPYKGDRGPWALLCVAALPSSIQQISVPCVSVPEGENDRVTVSLKLQSGAGPQTTNSVHACLSVLAVDIIPCRDWSFTKSWK